jgi:putative ABC transport system permease protein
MPIADVRYALRLWRRYPTLVVVAGLSLGLGVGATTTMFSVVNNVANYKLNFKDVDQLAVLWTTDREQGNDQSPPDWELVQAILQHGHSFETFGFFQGSGAPVTLSGVEVSRVLQMPVDVGGLSITGIPPFLGRTYRRGDFEDVVKQKEARSIVVAYETWQRLLGGARDVVGKTIHVDGEPRTVIGVMPPGFRILPWEDQIAFWAANDLSRIPKATWMIAVGRLRPGVTPEAAEAESTVIAQSVMKSRGRKAGGVGTKVERLHEAYFGGARRGLSFLLGAVSFVLLIACANVANMLLAAGAARQKELAVRAAAGAGRRRLLAQLLMENLMLSLVGCAFGLALTFGGIRLFAVIVPQELPDLLRHNPIDVRVLAFALAISTASSLLFGLIPALQASRVDFGELLKEGGRGGAGSHHRGRTALLVAEVSLAMVLLVGAGLMMRGFMREQRQLPGFSTEGLVTGEILLGGTRYFDKTPQDMNLVTPMVEAFYDQVLERVRALPGVQHAGIISKLPLQVEPFPFTIVGQPEPDSRKRPRADVNEVDAQAFDTLGIRLLRGRGIGEGDVAGAPWVAVVNQTFAERHFPGQDPLGRAFRLSMGDPGPASVDEPQLRTIVGVVADVTYPSFFDEKPAAIYIPFRQHVWQYAREDEWLHTRKVLAIRATVEPLTLVPAVRAAVAQVDRDQAVHDFKTMDERVRTSPSVTNSRFFASLFAVFGLLAVLLAMVGVYGVMSWVVGRRTGEFIIRMLLGQSLRPILVGLLLGTLGGYGLSRALNGMFFRMTTAEPLVFVGIAALMLAVALSAAWVPARRVTRIDPQQALRCE